MTSCPFGHVLFRRKDHWARTRGGGKEESEDQEVGVIKSHLGCWGPPHMNAQSCSFATTRHPVQLDPMHTPEMLVLLPMMDQSCSEEQPPHPPTLQMTLLIHSLKFLSFFTRYVRERNSQFDPAGSHLIHFH